ncbi:MAG: hypothetical protein IJN48_02865 [Clostridia bacterium]|nr:hypothetical protein [Clostridia bacterium]
MTKERLEKLPSLNREIRRTQKRLDRLEESRSKSARHKAALKRTREALDAYLTEAQQEAATLMNYIKTIEDSSTREIFMLRYYDGIRSWQQIAFMVGEHDESYVRKKHSRYLKKEDAA